jgi:hypothetical protein
MHGDEKIIYANNLKFDKYWKRKIKKSIQHSFFFIEVIKTKNKRGLLPT